MTDTITGPLWAARNWSADAGAGSIHDDTTAASLGFRGGTVAGDVHMNQFVPVLLQVFGNEWFETGNLSLRFKNATTDRERVRVYAQPLKPEKRQTYVWMERDDGLLVAEGTAAIGDHTGSALRQRDFRPCEPKALRILSAVEPGMSLGDHSVMADPQKQFERYDQQLISDPLDWYRNGSPWKEVVAAPCTVIEYLWGYPIKVLEPLMRGSVGLFGAIEIGFTNGPLLLNQQYTITGEVLCVGQSPQTEYVWFETHAHDERNRKVATMLMQGRAMKASSPLYQESMSSGR